MPGSSRLFNDEFIQMKKLFLVFESEIKAQKYVDASN